MDVDQDDEEEKDSTLSAEGSIESIDFEVETMRGLAKLRARQELETLYREYEESVTDSSERERIIPLIRECVRYQD